MRPDNTEPYIVTGWRMFKKALHSDWSGDGPITVASDNEIRSAAGRRQELVQAQSAYAKTANEPFTYAHCWTMWITNTIMAWGPIAIIGTLLHAGLLRDILRVAATIWLLSACSTARFSPVARNFPVPLFIGGVGVLTLGFVSVGSALASCIFVLLALIFILTPSYAKFAEAERSKSH